MGKLFENCKIGICSHAHDTVPFNVHENLSARFAKWNTEFNIILLGIAGFKNASARNILIDKAIEEGCTHVLFLDVDHITDENLLGNLLSHEGAAMASGLICKRKAPYPQVGFVRGEDGEYRSINLPLNDKPYRVDVCAFGCTLLHLGWLTKLQKPYFRDEMQTNKEGKPFQKRSDVIICERLKEIGGEIIVDTRSQIGHITDPRVVYPHNRDIFEQVENLFNGIDIAKTDFQVPVYKKAQQIVKENNLSTVVDLGCGDGKKLTTLIKPHTNKVIGLDKSENKLKHALERCPDGMWLCGDLTEKLPLTISSSCLIICADVLEHLEQPEKLLEQIPKDVWCVFSTPDTDTCSDTISHNTGHKQFWNKETFKNLLTAHTFSIKELISYDEILPYQGLIAICRKE